MTCVLAKALTAGKVNARSGFVRSLCWPHGLPFWLGPCLLFTCCSGLKGESIDFKHLEASLTQVPRTFLTLAHSVEGQREMGLKPEQEAAMDRLLKEADGPCLRVRHLAPEIQRPILAKAEKQVAQAILDLLGSQALVRLRQLELQSQGVRAYVRPEVMQFMQLDATQIHDLKSLFEQTDLASARSRASAQSLYSKEAGSDQAATAALAAANVLRLSAAETKAADRILSHDQRKRYRDALGTRMDTSRFDRLYPQAPELVDSGQWLGGRETTLAAHRGKVILVHFYAFQCHNCHANFSIYNRWQEKLVEKGAVVIGIQTPETRAESDPERITRAAQESGFSFPVLYDLQKANWDAWSNTVWPAVYVVDKRGYIRYWWLGELQWQGARGDKVIERLVSSLLLE
jgi:peroxiredoxin